ncbi:MAG: hypothetical protein WBC55_02470 [Dehalococcoidia bacterium]
MLLITVVIAIAVIATIAATGGFEPGATPTPTPTPTLTNSFYATDVRGGYVYKLYFELFNGSPETITIWKIEFLNPDDKVEYLISDEGIAELLQGTNQVAPSDSCFGSIIFEPPLLLSEVEEWEAEWHCVRADGQDFVVVGAFKEGF